MISVAHHPLKQHGLLECHTFENEVPSASSLFQPQLRCHLLGRLSLCLCPMSIECFFSLHFMVLSVHLCGCTCHVVCKIPCLTEGRDLVSFFFAIMMLIISSYIESRSNIVELIYYPCAPTALRKAEHVSFKLGTKAQTQRGQTTCQRSACMLQSQGLCTIKFWLFYITVFQTSVVLGTMFFELASYMHLCTWWLLKACDSFKGIHFQILNLHMCLLIID